MAIDNPWIMTRDTVKTILQISDTSADTLIDFYLPIVSSAVDLITNCLWVGKYSGTITISSAIISSIEFLEADIEKGQLISTSQYVNSAITDYDVDASTITGTTNGTATATAEDILINTFPRAMTPTVAQMVGFQIVKNNGTASTTKGNLTSKSFGPLSCSYSDLDNALANGFGYPGYMIASLKLVTAPRFK